MTYDDKARAAIDAREKQLLAADPKRSGARDLAAAQVRRLLEVARLRRIYAARLRESAETLVAVGLAVQLDASGLGFEAWSREHDEIVARIKTLAAQAGNAADLDDPLLRPDAASRAFDPQKPGLWTWMPEAGAARIDPASVRVTKITRRVRRKKPRSRKGQEKRT